MTPDPLAALVLFGVVVEGTSTCPTPVAVEERLRALSPAEARADLVRLVPVEGGVQLTLLRATGGEPGIRTITGPHSCDELAEAAAVVISTWQLELGVPGSLPAPPPPAVVTPPVQSTPVAARPSSSWRWEVGAGAGAGLSGADMAPAALLLASLGRGERLGLAARAQISGNRSAALPDGRASWRRALLAIGPRVRLGGAAITEAHAAVGASWLSIQGAGFRDARAHHDLVVGVAGGLRLIWNRVGARPWVDAGAAFWPGRSVVYQEPDRRSVALPRLEVLLTLGLSFGR